MKNYFLSPTRKSNFVLVLLPEAKYDELFCSKTCVGVDVVWNYVTLDLSRHLDVYFPHVTRSVQYGRRDRAAFIQNNLIVDYYLLLLKIAQF